MDDFEDLYAEAEKRRAILELANDNDREAIQQARARIRGRNSTLALIPRRPIQRKRKSELDLSEQATPTIAGLFEQMNKDMQPAASPDDEALPVFADKD